MYEQILQQQKEIERKQGIIFRYFFAFNRNEKGSNKRKPLIPYLKQKTTYKD